MVSAPVRQLREKPPVNLSNGHGCSTTLCKINILSWENLARTTGGVFIVLGVDFVLSCGFLGVLPSPSSLDLISAGST